MAPYAGWRAVIHMQTRSVQETASVLRNCVEQGRPALLRLEALENDHVAGRCGLAEGFGVGVVIRRPPGADHFHRRELEQHQTLRLPRAFEHLGRCAADEKTSTELADADRGHLLVVLVSHRVFHINVRDYVCRHRFYPSRNAFRNSSPRSSAFRAPTP